MTFWLDKNSPLTWNSQSDCFASASHRCGTQKSLNEMSSYLFCSYKFRALSNVSSLTETCVRTFYWKENKLDSLFLQPLTKRATFNVKWQPLLQAKAFAGAVHNFCSYNWNVDCGERPSEVEPIRSPGILSSWSSLV